MNTELNDQPDQSFQEPAPAPTPKRRVFNPYLPLWFSIVLVIGLLLGTRISRPVFKYTPERGSASKLDQIMQLIGEEYVDTISEKQLTEKAIASLLQNLDPHSAYIPAEETREMNEPLQGNFEGIGVEFNILNDTIMVVAALAGGPSEAVGLRAGDRIVKIEGKNVAGVKIKNKDVVSKLRGKGGTKVTISILRRGTSKELPFTITRGKIPIHSLETSYMLDKEIGYIRISRFAATTYEEYLNAFHKLKQEGMKKLVLDLRGNPGGYLTAAINLSDEFLPKNKMIVYTQGKARPKEVFSSTSTGKFETEPLVILIDEGSASASEIVAGAIQDNDRGTIIGRRSFGKGLVQQQIDFPDSSALRLTIARYYTPTGRSIQKPYSSDIEGYYNEEYDRLKKGELLNKDSIHFSDSLKFLTPKGKIVYGGGGIMPDIFVPLDTSGRSEFLGKLLYSGAVNQFSLDYADQHRATLRKYGNFNEFVSRFVIDEAMLNSFYAYAEKSGVKGNAASHAMAEPLLKVHIKGLIARVIWGNDAYYRVIQDVDNILNKAIEELKKENGV